MQPILRLKFYRGNKNNMAFLLKFHFPPMNPHSWNLKSLIPNPNHEFLIHPSTDLIPPNDF